VTVAAHTALNLGRPGLLTTVNPHHGKADMAEPSDIKAQMEVRSSDGLHVGTVDHLDGDTLIKLTRTDPVAHGRHHLLPLSWVERVDEQVHLTATAADVRGYWEDAGAV
jgi:hypothetical protein